MTRLMDWLWVIAMAITASGLAFSGLAHWAAVMGFIAGNQFQICVRNEVNRCLK